MRALANLDFYRKVERDLTKGTLVGALLSVAGAGLMLALFTLELRDYLSTQLTSELRVDEFEDSFLQINLNVTLPRVPCPYLSIDFENVLGTHKANLTQTVRKWRVKGPARESAAQHKPAHAIEVQMETTPRAEGDAKPLAVSADNVAALRAQHEVLLVAFYAPWCVWSKKLMPVWEQVAQEAGERFGPRVGVAKVDCTGSDSETKLCHHHHVSAFPTVVTFQQQSGPGDAATLYHGDRTADAFLAHAASALATPGSGGGQRPEEPGAGDGSASAGEGCQVSGYVLAKKVPGTLIISAVSPKHSIDLALVNMSHVVHHLSFGQLFLEEEVARLPAEVTEAMRGQSGRSYVSDAPGQTHEHYLKVIGTLYKYLGAGALSTYKYTCHSAAYQGAARMPVVRFQYDISPINVVVTEAFKPFYHFLTSLFAIIGGVFTVFGIVDAFVYNGVGLVRRKLALGKQS